MKIVIWLILVFLVFSCKSNKNQNIVDTQDSVSAIVEKVEVQKGEDKSEVNLLNGTWAESEESNAVFVIEDSLLYYFEQFDNPVPLEYGEDYFNINGAVAVQCKVLKLTADSLIYLVEDTKDIVKLIKVD